MKAKPVTAKQVLAGAAVSTVATEVAIKAFPELRPLAPIAHAVTILGLLLLLEELLRQPAH